MLNKEYISKPHKLSELELGTLLGIYLWITRKQGKPVIAKTHKEIREDITGTKLNLIANEVYRYGRGIKGFHVIEHMYKNKGE